jgi:hypothetical protein
MHRSAIAMSVVFPVTVSRQLVNETGPMRSLRKIASTIEVRLLVALIPLGSHTFNEPNMFCRMAVDKQIKQQQIKRKS